MEGCVVPIGSAGCCQEFTVTKEDVMQGSLEVGTIAGIEIRLQYTWLLALLLLLPQPGVARRDLVATASKPAPSSA
jgi:hypothetical protein